MKLWQHILFLLCFFAFEWIVLGKQKGTTLSSKYATDKKNKRGGTRKAGRIPIIPVKESLSKKATRTLNQLEKAVRQTRTLAITQGIILRREMAEFFSSDFEVLLLKLTKPKDARPIDADVDRFLNTIEDFVRDADTTNPVNPYRTTLHKLWCKTAELNGYTVLKALFLLHTILRYTQPDDALIFKRLVFKMTKEECQRTGTKYFDEKRVANVDSYTSHLSDFILRYNAYLIKRGRAFTSQFEELHCISRNMRPDDIVAQLLKSMKVIDAALLCRTEPDEECEVSMSCLELLARDVRELFLLFHAQLRFVVAEHTSGRIFDEWPEAEVNTVIQHFKSYYNDRFEEIEAFLQDAAELLELYPALCSFPSSLNIPALFDSHTASREEEIKDDKRDIGEEFTVERMSMADETAQQDI